MVWTGIFATLAECASKAGENVDVTGWVEANHNQWNKEIESLVNTIIRYNFSDKYGTLNADVQGILTMIASSYVGIKGISYNMGGYTSRVEAEDMVNILRDDMLRGLSVLRDKKVEDFMKNA